MPITLVAQDSDTLESDDSDGALEEVVVTGTRIKRRDFSSPSPLVTIDREMLAFSGQPTLEESLNRMPQLSPDFGRTANNPSDGTSRLNLRGLGADRTLVLLNGRRVAPSGVESAVDVNNLPRVLIERVEIITGGASAVYGSDAIAGVVNFITRDDFEGFGIESSYSISEAGDANIFDVNLTYGMTLPGSAGHITFFAGYYDREPLFASERELTRQAYIDTWEGELIVGGSPSTPAGQVRSPRVDLGNGRVDRLTFNPDGSPRAFVAPDDLWNFAPVNYLQAPLTRYAVGAFGTIPIGDDFEGYFEASYTRNEATSNLAPVPAQSFVLINTDNPILHPDTAIIFEEQLLVGPGLAGFTYLKRLSDFGPRIINRDRDYARLVVGLRGDLGENWDLDAWLSYTDADETEVLLNGVSRSRYAQGLLVDPATGTCYDPSGGCVALDIFGENRISAAGLAFLSVGPLENTTQRKQVLAAAVISGEPFATWAGPVGMAFGAEWRSDEAFFKADDLLFSADVLGYQAQSSVIGTERVWELYSEAVVPLFDGGSDGQYFGLELGGRYSSYDNAGSTETWKAGFDWRLNPSIRFRAMLQQSVRAPNLSELFTEQVEEFTTAFFLGAFDPCSASNDPASAGSAEKCVIQGLSPSQVGVFQAEDSYPGTTVSGGNPDLTPEQADTLTFGVVFTPASISRLTVTVDYFDLQIDDTIGEIDPFGICFDSLNTGNLFCDQIRRDQTGNVNRVISLVQNRGLLAAEGVDTQVQYLMDLPDWAALDGDATLNLGTIWTHTISSKTQENPTTEEYDCAGYFGWPCRTLGVGSFPEDRLFTTFDYSSGRFSAQLAWRWIDSMRNAAPFASGIFGFPDPDLAIEGVSSANYFDLGMGWQINPSLSLRFVISNLFEQDPPNMADTIVSNNTDSSLYDVFGRSYYLSFTWRPAQ